MKAIKISYVILLCLFITSISWANSMNNVILNSSFELSADGQIPDEWLFWKGAGEPTYGIDSTQANTGTRSVKIVSNSRSDRGAWITDFKNNNFVGGTQVRAELYYKIRDGYNTNIKFGVFATTKDRKAVELKQIELDKNATDWCLVTMDIEVPDDTIEFSLRCILEKYSDPGATVWLDDVKFYEVERNNAFLTSRHNYYRGEKIKICLRTDASSVLFSINGLLQEQITSKHDEAIYIVDTGLLREGNYEVQAQLFDSTEAGNNKILRFPIKISPGNNPQRLSVWMWGNAAVKSFDWWKERGFTGVRCFGGLDPIDPNSLQAREYDYIFEEGIRSGLDIGVYLYPLKSERWQNKEEVLCRVTNGNFSKIVYPRHPEVLDFARKTADIFVSRFKKYPSFTNVLLNTEYQVDDRFINDEIERLAREEAGISNLKEVIDLKPSTPENGIINDDDPKYRYLKWWWEKGNGSNILNKEMAKEIKNHRPDLLTWNDPYRTTSVYDTHTGLDFISTWTYLFPDIKNMCYTNILQAVAKKEQQKVMQTISLFVYDYFVIPPQTDTIPEEYYGDNPGQRPYFMADPDVATD